MTDSQQLISNNLKLHLDASDSSRITTADGNNLVSQIQDLINSSLGASQTDNAKKPVLVANALNGKSVIEFDGDDDHLVMPNHPAINPVSAFAIAALVYLDPASSNDGGISTIVARTVSVGPNGYNLFWDDRGSATNSFGIYMKGNESYRQIFAVNAITEPGWYVAIATYDSSLTSENLKLYVGDSLKNTANTTQQFGAFTKDLTIGAFEKDTGPYTKMRLAELLFYDVGLTQSQVSQTSSYLHNKWLNPGNPSQPANLTAQDVTASSVKLTWSPPADTGDSPVTGYRIEQKTTVAGTYETIVPDTGNVTEYDITGLSQLTQYFFRIYAVNSHGESIASDEIQVVTTAAGTGTGISEEQLKSILDEKLGPIQKMLYADIEMTSSQVIFRYSGEEIARFDLNANSDAADASGGRTRTISS